MYYKYDFKPKLITRISSVSRCNMKRGFVQPAHAHAYYGHEIIYLDYGRMDLTIDGRELQLNTGEIFCLFDVLFHKIKSYLSLIFSEVYAFSLFNTSGFI